MKVGESTNYLMRKFGIERLDRSVIDTLLNYISKNKSGKYITSYSPHTLAQKKIKNNPSILKRQGIINDLEDILCIETEIIFGERSVDLIVVTDRNVYVLELKRKKKYENILDYVYDFLKENYNIEARLWRGSYKGHKFRFSEKPRHKVFLSKSAYRRRWK